MAEYREKIQPQLLDLATGAIVHPSIPKTGPHQSFLVTNRGLEEEVIRSIDDFNRAQVSAGRTNSNLGTIVRGQILDMAKIGLLKARRMFRGFWLMLSDTG